MTYKTLLTDTDPRGVATVTLNRSDKRNALSGKMIDELTHCAAALGADDAVRAVVLRGAGAIFCAGGDLNWMRAQIDADGETRAREAGKLAAMLGAWNELPKPVIGRIEGSAFGGGVGLACVCDVAIAAPDAKFGLTETKLGLIPATIGPYVIARMGEGNARRVFMSGRIFGAEEAQRLGVVASVSDDLDGAIEAEITPYLACAPGAVAEAKALALHLGGAPGQAAVDHSIKALVTRWESEESAEGIAAFFDKRKAAWVR
ncbi:crotonase/enoyl-CoA hydratase family protein [Litoreibacter arenae]|uniref:Methylglutaconyl-CoA hydratase n=1 Tax=Litoreibacter arenae DSM 19593 TaxID=1123360 RepID=S9QJY9_9RHOB|nr:crotonase/enoyl-CoA hydratase family protein [Litoreibacter arenae]EPX79918.1 Methylglutaconyl-CoA hydratase [Litoreibacter arenae DSM 19593]